MWHLIGSATEPLRPSTLARLLGCPWLLVFINGMASGAAPLRGNTRQMPEPLRPRRWQHERLRILFRPRADCCALVGCHCVANDLGLDQGHRGPDDCDGCRDLRHPVGAQVAGLGADPTWAEPRRSLGPVATHC